MCPESEIRFRMKNDMVHLLEKSDDGRKDVEGAKRKMVKEYTRPAAGCDHLHPDILRPPDVLLVTVRYLMDLYKSQKTSRFNAAFSFVSDRLRAVRQDMILQDICPKDTLELLEEMIPFYLETEYLCRTRKCDAYDWKLHSTQLQECLSRWTEASAELPLGSECPNIRCAYVLRQIDSPTALLQLYIWKNHLPERLFLDLREIIVAFRSNNYVRFFRHLRRIPEVCYPVAAVGAVQTLRLRAIQVITSAYKSPGLKLPVTTLARWLAHENVCELLAGFSASCSDVVVISSINVNSPLNNDCKRLLPLLYPSC
ncbi:hypothetical protein Q1695_011744 [Nippostrongylus brasiliensis]|nr:hypothetical protein Q1695_011744 [Nippostrongylus brasiliensis]